MDVMYLIIEMILAAIFAVLTLVLSERFLRAGIRRWGWILTGLVLIIAADAVKFIQDVGEPNVKVHLDTFHMIREEDNIPRAVLETGEYVGYVHACENQRGIPGTGQVPWREFFQALKQIGYDGCITIESFDPNMERIAKLCCIWRKLADSPEQLAAEGLRFLKQVYAEVSGS